MNTTISRLLHRLFYAVALLTVVSCGGDGGGGNGSSAAINNLLGGNAIKGPIYNAEVMLVYFDEFGQEVEIEATNAPVMTDVNGGFMFDTPFNKLPADVGPGILRTIGGTTDPGNGVAPTLEAVIPDLGTYRNKSTLASKHLSTASSVAAGLLKLEMANLGARPSVAVTNALIDRVEISLGVDLDDDPALMTSSTAAVNRSVDALLSLQASSANNAAINEHVDYLVENLASTSGKLDGNMRDPANPGVDIPAALGTGTLAALFPDGPAALRLLSLAVDKAQIENDGIDSAMLTVRVHDGAGSLLTDPDWTGYPAKIGINVVSGQAVLGKETLSQLNGKFDLRLSSTSAGTVTVEASYRLQNGNILTQTVPVQVVNAIADTAQEIALQKIIAYAEDESNSEPALQDYIDAGVSGVSSENLAALNAVVGGLDSIDVDTIVELEALTTQLGINIAPTVNAGTDQTVQVNQSITITGTATDSDGTIASYQWTKGITVLATTPGFSYTPGAVGTDTLTLTVTDNYAATASASIDVDVVGHNVNYLGIARDGSPLGAFWYVGDKKWERDEYNTCVGLTETGREGWLIYLTDADGVENLTIDLQAMTITSDTYSDLEVWEADLRDRAESSSLCPSTSNDYTPVITSATEVEVNGGRTMVLTLKASDEDLPPEDLSFSLTTNPETDNDLFKITNFSEKARAACRAGTANQGAPGDPKNPDYFIVEDGVNSLEECQAACNQHPLHAGSAFSCKGIEYREEGADPVYPEPNCELWKHEIVDTVPQPAYGCYTRESETLEVLSFINAPDFKIPLDTDVNNVYEVEAEVSDGVDGNSSTQTILVTVVPNGDYIGRSGTACRAGTLNEGHPEDPYNANYFTVTNGVKSVEDCQALCDAYPLSGDPGTNCMGVEYRAEGADYADLISRCELWKAPIVATTPQKEYACYVRDLVRDDYGPDITAYVGDYKAPYLNVIEYVTKTMTLDQSPQSPSELLWTAQDGTSWTVARTADRNKLKVGDDYPFKGDGYEEPEVIWDADEVAGITGPSGLIYRTDWAHAKLAHSQAVYQEYINNHPGELIRRVEAQRQLRELKWAIAEKINTAAGYRAYKSEIDLLGDASGRTVEANDRIGSFKAFVTAEVLQIEVDEDVSWVPEPAGENNDLELFYNLEFGKDWNPRADEQNWTPGDVMLTSVTQIDGSKITNINDGADDAFIPAGVAEKTVEATENLTLRYGGLMFEVDSLPNFNKPDCEDFDQSGACKEPGLEIDQFFSNTSTLTVNASYPEIDGIFDDYHWAQFGARTWAGNAATATESLNSTYFTIALADLEYEVPKIETKSVKFASDEEIRVMYEITKRTEEQYNEYIAANALYCDDPALKSEKLIQRSSVTIDPPGFLIRNETDHTYSVSLNQVGPLYYEEVAPGHIFKRDTAWGHFTIDAKLNLTGEQIYSDWDVAQEIGIFTAEVLQTVLSGGAPISSFKFAIEAAGKKAIAKLTAKAAASGLSSNIFGRALLRAGVQSIKLLTGLPNASATIRIATALGKKAGKTIVLQSIDYDTNDAFDEVFAQDLADNIYSEDNTEEDRSWSYSGAWPSNVGMYHIVGGPRLPCLTSDGDIEIRSSKLEILNDEECRARPDICTL